MAILHAISAAMIRLEAAQGKVTHAQRPGENSLARVDQYVHPRTRPPHSIPSFRCRDALPLGSFTYETHRAPIYPYLVALPTFDIRRDSPSHCDAVLNRGGTRPLIRRGNLSRTVRSPANFADRRRKHRLTFSDLRNYSPDLDPSPR